MSGDTTTKANQMHNAQSSVTTRRGRVTRVPHADALDTHTDRIRAALSQTVAGIFETGAALADAKAALSHGEWGRLFEEGRVPLSQSSAVKFIAIHKGRERLLPNSEHVTNLPPSWGTLYELAQLPEDTLAWAHDQGRISPTLERRDVKLLRDEFAGTADTPVNEQHPAAPIEALTPLNAEAASRAFDDLLARIDYLAARWPTSNLWQLVAGLENRAAYISRQIESQERAS